MVVTGHSTGLRAGPAERGVMLKLFKLPIAGIRPFALFLYCDHLWVTTTKFPENFELTGLHPPCAPYTDPIVG